MPQAEPPDPIKARRADLTRRYITGGKLTPAEIKEAGLPDPRNIIHKQTSDAYQRSLASYAKTYGRDVRNLKRWVSDGRKQTPADLPPFDDPPSMAEWFRRVKGREPGDNLTRFEDGGEDGGEGVSEPEPPAPKSGGKAPGDSAAAPPSAGELPSLPAMHLDMTMEASSDLGLQQVKALVIALYNQMGIALKNNREKEFTNLLGKWQRAVQTLRAWEKDIIKIQEGRGEVLRTRVINTEIVAIFATMGQSFYNGIRAVLRKHAQQMSEPEQRKLSRKLRDDCFLQTRNTRYQQAWTDAQATMVLEAEIVEPTS